MNNKLNYFSLGFFILALVLGFGASSANAALTLGALAVTSDGVLSLDSASTLNLQIGGASKLTVDSTGKVGIGTATPSLNLDVLGQSSFVNNPLGYTGSDWAWETGAALRTMSYSDGVHWPTGSTSIAVLNSSLPGSLGQNMLGVFGRSRFPTGTSGTFTASALGGYFQIDNRSAVNFTDAVNGIAALQVEASSWSATGNIALLRGIRMYIGAAGGGLSSATIDRAEGLYIGTIKNSRVTTSYAILTTGAEDMVSFAGKLGVGSTIPNGKLDVIGAPTASANYGLLNIGAAATGFDGSTAGFFAGSASGTQLALNAASGFTGNLVDMQLAGASKFKVTSAGVATASSFLMPTSAETLVDGADGGASCSSTNKGAIVIDVANKFYGCDGTDWQVLD
jgi:hypothetical protein